MIYTPSVLASVVSLTVFGFAAATKPFSFVAIGDWGGAALSTQNSDNVYAVANQMAITASANEAQFVLNVGDNFYWCGIQNTTDYLIETDFVNAYSNASLQIPWWSTLGNHEYGYNVSAQIDYSNVNPLWHMPNRYYYTRMQLEGENYMTMIVLDTTPCVSGYRGTDASNYDPCGTDYPTCSLSDGDDDFQGECYFHTNVITQDCNLQYTWFQDVLDNHVPSHDWLLVVGHHPIDELDVVDFTSAMQKHGFSIYINGHTHLLNQYTLDNAGAYVTTGAGAMVNTPDQQQGVTRAKRMGLSNEQIERAKVVEGAGVGATHTYQTVYTNTIAGFTSHTFNSDYTRLTTDYISYAGDVVHTFTVNKGGKIVQT